MTEKRYRLNKWGTKLLKNNRPLFDWANEADDIVDLLNDLSEENERLKNFKSEVFKLIDKKINKIKNTDECSLIPRESIVILKELKKELM